MFEKDQLRLELVKICFRHGVHPDKIVVDAKILETYVLEDSKAEPVVKPQPAQSGKGKNNREHPYS